MKDKKGKKIEKSCIKEGAQQKIEKLKKNDSVTPPTGHTVSSEGVIYFFYFFSCLLQTYKLEACSFI